MPINCCQNTTATTTFLPVTSCCCCCSCSNPVEKPTMQKATIESRAMRDAAAAVANGQNGFLLCVGCHFIVHVAGDAAAAAAWCLLQMLPLPQVLLPALLLLRHQIVRTRHKNRSRKNEIKTKSAKREKRKSQFEPDCSLDHSWINEWMYIKHMMTIRGVKHPDKTLKYPESCFYHALRL